MNNFQEVLSKFPGSSMLLFWAPKQQVPTPILVL